MNSYTRRDQVLAWCEESKALLLRHLEVLTNMDSGSDDIPELRAKALHIKHMCEEVGGTVELVPGAAPQEDVCTVLSTWKGKGKARILLMAHYDTVWPKGEGSRRPFHIKGNYAFGPGVNDRQNSIAAFPVFVDILLHKMGCTDFDTLTILINGDEEKGSFSSRDLIMKLAAEYDVVYSTDGSCHTGDIIYTHARGTAYYEIHVQGVESHAGAAPEAGRNAGYEMAYQVLKMRDLSNKALGTDVNWTMGSFGSKSNVIPGTAYAHANARIPVASEYERVENDIRRCIEDKLFPESEIVFKIKRGRPPFEKNERTDALAAKIVAIAKEELDFVIRPMASGGAGDTSYAYPTAPVVIDVSLGGSYPHSIDECYNLDHIVPRLYLWLRMVEETMRGNMVPLAANSDARR